METGALYSSQGDDYKINVRLSVMHGSEASCLEKIEMKIMQRTEGSMVKAMCGIQLKDRRSKDWTLMLHLNETIN